MRIDRLTLENFRNYARQSFCFDSSCNVIFGDNAQGKTNLLESIVYLSCGRSPRARSDREMIAFDCESACIDASLWSRERDFSVQIALERARRRRISVNKVRAKSGAALSDVLNTVFFCPEDLSIIREGASARRRFMDMSLCQLRPRYDEALGKYTQLYEHKTRILRDSEKKPDLLHALPDFNEQLIQYGAVLIHYRAAFCARLGEYARAAHAECSGGKETLSLHYETVKTVRDPFAEHGALVEGLREQQKEHYHAEIAARLCLCGAHKDDISVFINDRPAKMYSSQGQTRTAALAMKLAQREIHKNVMGEYPVLLLDDVLSELDPRRQEYVLNRICDGQLFITCCEDDRLAKLLGGKIFHVHGGEVE